MKLLLIIENTGAVAQIRLLSPLNLLKQAGSLDYDLFVLDEPRSINLNQLHAYDALIFQRTSLADTVELMKQAKARGVKVIYDIDDNLLQLPDTHPLFEQFTDPAVAATIKEHLELADLVTVSTPVLWGALAEYNDKRVVIRNEIDQEIFPRALAKRNQPVTIGYAAGWTHASDMEQIVPALERLLAEYGAAIKLVFFWLTPDSLKGHPQVEHLAGFPKLQDYAARLHTSRIDIGLAPLVDNPFNNAKSDVKYLEYGSQAIVGIYSRALPYSSVIDGKTGLFVDSDNPDEWYERIKYLIDNPVERHQLASQAMLDVSANRTVQHMAESWTASLQGLSDTRKLPGRPVVSIIMLTYNALEYTRECVESIRYHTAYPHEIIFIDNASSDGTVQYLEQVVAENPHYRMITNADNRGFAAGNNQGVKDARGDYVLLLNNDVLVSSGWLEDMVAAFERDPQIGMVGPITNHLSGRQVIADIPYTDTPGFHNFADQVRSANRGTVTPRRRIAGFAILMSKALYDELGGLEEIFGSGNYEDDDLCLRVRERGYAIMVDEGTFIHHYGSKTFVANQLDQQASLDHNEILFRERWPEIDHDWLLEIGTPLTHDHKARLDAAADLITQGDLEAAEQNCRTVISENPISSQAYYGLGVIAQRNGDSGAAKQQFQRAYAIDPTSVATIKQLAEIDLLTGEASVAQRSILSHLEKNPEDIEALFILARALLAQEMFEEAVPLLLNITNLEPAHWEAHLTMALLHDELEQAAEVLKHAHAVLEHNPGLSEAQQLIDKYR